MRNRNLFLAVLAGGPVLGMLAGIAVDPTIQPREDPPWRKLKPDIIFTGADEQLAEAAPEDFGPPRYGEARIMLLARRFAADADDEGPQYLPVEDSRADDEVAPPSEPQPEPGGEAAERAGYDANAPLGGIDGEAAAAPDDSEPIAGGEIS